MDYTLMKVRLQFPIALLVLFGLALTCAAHPLDSWYSRFTNSSASFFYSAAYGGGAYAAVGSSGAIASSTNGSQWTVTNLTTQILNGVAYGAGKFVAVGYGGTVLTSSNAVNWEDHSPGTNIYLQKIFWGNSRFVALGYTISPAFNWSLVSTDGVTWSNYYIASNKPTGELVFGSGLFVYSLAIGTNLLSADGVSWWSQPTGLTNSLYMIGSSGNTLVAFDTHDQTFTSGDGTNWTFRGANSLLRPQGLAYGNGFWVAVSAGIHANYSADLVHWTTVSNAQTTASSVCFGNGSFLTVGGVFCQSAPVIVLQAMPGLPGAITLFGPAGVTYQIQTLDALGPTGWQTVSNLTVTSTPYLWTDPDAAGQPQKFYRVLLP
jgi:hypothetical protein